MTEKSKPNVPLWYSLFNRYILLVFIAMMVGMIQTQVFGQGIVAYLITQVPINIFLLYFTDAAIEESYVEWLAR